jgi:hypothetical protein
MFTKKERQTKKKDNMEDDEGKHTEIVCNGDGDSKSINDTNTFSYSEHNNMTDKPCLGNNNNYYYDELAYPFSKRIKLKHERKRLKKINQYNILQTLL